MRKDKFKFVLIRTTMNEWMGDHQHSKLKTSENILENVKKKCLMVVNLKMWILNKESIFSIIVHQCDCKFLPHLHIKTPVAQTFKTRAL